MLHARSLCGLRCHFVPCCEVVNRADQQESIDSRKCCPHRRRIREIADEDIHAIAVARSCLLRIAHQNSRPITAIEKALTTSEPMFPVAPVMR
jgi:hypothetical protein